MKRKVKVGDRFTTLLIAAEVCPQGTKLRKVISATMTGGGHYAEWTNGYEVVELPGPELPTGLGAVVELFDPQDGIVHDTAVRCPRDLWQTARGRTYSTGDLRTLLTRGPKLEMRVISEGVSL